MAAESTHCSVPLVCGTVAKVVQALRFVELSMRCARPLPPVMVNRACWFEATSARPSPESVTVTVCAHVAVFPLGSCAVQITVVTPLLNCAGALLQTVTLPELSLAVAVNRATPVA